MSSTFYENYWDADARAMDGQTWPELQCLLADVLPDKGRVLDLGCGDGATAGTWIASNGYRHLGADISLAALCRARQRGLRVLQVGSAHVLPFADHSFDAVVCIDVLEHLFEPDAAVAEAQRVLRPRGVLVATTPNIAYWRSRVKLGFGLFDPLGDPLTSKETPWRDPHIRFFTAHSLRRMLEGVGFERVDITGQQGSVLGNLPYVRKWWTPPSGGRFYKRLEQRFGNLLGYRIAAVARR